MNYEVKVSVTEYVDTKEEAEDLRNQILEALNKIIPDFWMEQVYIQAVEDEPECPEPDDELPF